MRVTTRNTFMKVKTNLGGECWCIIMDVASLAIWGLVYCFTRSVIMGKESFPRIAQLVSGPYQVKKQDCELCVIRSSSSVRRQHFLNSPYET